MKPSSRLNPLGPNFLDSSGDVRYCANFFSSSEAGSIFDRLRDQISWKHESIKLFGKEVLQPRLTALYGEESYRYSGRTMEPEFWTDDLLAIKSKVSAHVGTEFNVVLLNYYRDGVDSMGWHKDDEKELGKDPTIASLSFGASRVMQFRYGKSGAKISINLESGSLLIMQGQTQQNWYHSIPKSKATAGGRINLTFRKILKK